MSQPVKLFFVVVVNILVISAKKNDRVINFLSLTCETLDKKGGTVELCQINPSGTLDVTFNVLQSSNTFFASYNICDTSF